MSDPTATFLHLSDLHLGSNLQDVGGTHKTSHLSSLLNVGGVRMQAHDPYIVSTLATSILSAARFIGAPNDAFDFYLVTGDISTSADSDARFSFAHKFLTSKIVDQNFSVGLSIPGQALLCVPGNHDKLGESASPSRYLGSFGGCPSHLPYRKELRIERSKQSFIAYGIDSNLYTEGNMAVGRITPETLAWLANAFENDVKTVAIRVLVLHHHPADLKRFRRRSLRKLMRAVRSKFLPDLTRLEEGDRLLELCRGNVDIIFHGHEHFPVVFLDGQSDCLVVSAGTAAQYVDGDEPNSFHALRFDTSTVAVVQYDWTGSRFVPDLRWTCNLRDSQRILKEERLTTRR